MLYLKGKLVRTRW